MVLWFEKEFLDLVVFVKIDSRLDLHAKQCKNIKILSIYVCVCVRVNQIYLL